MKTLFAVLFLAAAGCTNISENNNLQRSGNPAALPEVTITEEQEELCYAGFSGNSNQDTSTVQLHLQGDKVSGKFIWKPYKKYARSGGLKGTRSNNRIQASWVFVQEGKIDSVEVQFRLEGDKLFGTHPAHVFRENRHNQEIDKGTEMEFVRIDCGAHWL